MRLKSVKYLIGGIIIVVLTMIGYLFSSYYSEYRKKEERKKLPELCLNDILERRICLNEIENKYVVIFYFYSDCNSCITHIEQVIKFALTSGHVTSLLITPSDEELIMSLLIKYQLNNLENIYLIRDKENIYYTYFGTFGVPAAFIYKNKNLIMQYTDNGNTKMNFFEYIQ